MRCNFPHGSLDYLPCTKVCTAVSSKPILLAAGSGPWHRRYGTGSIGILMILSFPHRLHLTGRSFTCVVGSSQSTVCFPHSGHKKRLCSDLVSSICCFSCNCYHLVFQLLFHEIRCEMPAPRSRRGQYMAQALRRRRKLFGIRILSIRTAWRTVFFTPGSRILLPVRRSQAAANSLLILKFLWASFPQMLMSGTIIR